MELMAVLKRIHVRISFLSNEKKGTSTTHPCSDTIYNDKFYLKYMYIDVLCN